MTVAGLDISGYPGDDGLAALATTNIGFCGVYLAPAPSHHDTGWMGKRALFDSLGLGRAYVYVGRQVTGPGTHIGSDPTGEGTEDGAQTVALLTQDGAPAGSVVFLDCENGPPAPPVQRLYIAAWAVAVEKGGYVAGVYVSHLMWEDVLSVHPNLKLWVFRVHAIGGSASSPFPAPDMAESGCPQALVWQRADNTTISVNGREFVVDLDVSSVRDPSAPQPEGNPQ